MSDTEILEKYNTLPINKQKDIDSFIFTIFESEQKNNYEKKLS